MARFGRATFAQVAGLPVLNLCLFSDFFRVARPTLAVRHRLLYVVLSAGLAFLKNRFSASFFGLFFKLPTKH